MRHLSSLTAVCEGKPLFFQKCILKQKLMNVQNTDIGTFAFSRLLRQPHIQPEKSTIKNKLPSDTQKYNKHNHGP
jgi:hypothetical protein